MTFDKAFRLYNYLLLLSGFFNLVAAGAVEWPIAGLYLVAVAVAWKIRTIRLSNAVQLVLVVLMLGWFLIDSASFSTLVQALVHLILLISLVKLFSAGSKRDYLLLYVISFVFVLLGSSFTISVFFLVTFGTYLFFAILAFMLFETQEAYLQNRKVRFSPWAYLQMSFVVTLLVMIFAIPIFVVIPRSGISFIRAGGAAFAQMTGFSDRVVLGDMGRILRDSRIVMRVRTDRPPDQLPADLKWRGIALDEYDGRAWRNTRRVEQQIFENQRYGGFLVPRNRRQKETLLRQTFSLEPFSNVVFGTADIILISNFANGRGLILEDGNSSFMFLPTTPSRITYVVYSDVISRSERLSLIGSPAPTEGDLAPYLQLPPLSPEVRTLAAHVAKGHATAVEQALAIERFLRQNYRYSLDNLSGSASDPLRDFLFNTRSGHCEYFAAAQAVLMRANGIPCRVVNGFRRGDYSSWSDHFVVRQSDAHSWVEGYFPGAGWVEFDPTPPDLGDRDFLLARWGAQWLDALDSFWIEVIAFDRIQQVTLFRSAGRQLAQFFLRAARLTEGVEAVRETFFAWLARLNLPAPVHLLWLIPLLVAPVLAAVRYRRYFRLFVKRRILRQPAEQLAPEYYREMLALLKRRGFVRRLSETPMEFVKRIGREFDNAVPARVTEIYYSNRFGSLPLETDQLSEIYEGLRTLRRWRRSPLRA